MPPPTPQRAACPSHLSRGGHGHAAGGSGVRHAHHTCGSIRGGGPARSVWWRDAWRPLTLGRRVAVWRRCQTHPPPSPLLNPPPPHRTASAAASAATPLPSTPASPSPWQPPVPPHSDSSGWGHRVRRVGRQAVGRRLFPRVECDQSAAGASRAALQQPVAEEEGGAPPSRRVRPQ